MPLYYTSLTYIKSTPNYNMKVNKSLKLRLYPNSSQQVLINKTLGSCRFLYNQMLAERIKVYKELKENKRDLYEYNYRTEKDYKEEFEWLKEVDSISLQQSRIDLSVAYQNFFKSLKKQRKGEQIGFPKFHKKGQKDSYRTCSTSNNIQIDFENYKVKLPKIGWINFRDQRTSFPGIIKSATVSKSKTGKYFVSILFEYEKDIRAFDTEKSLEKGLFVKGLDMSLDKFYVDDMGNSPEYQKLFRGYQNRLSYLQRSVSKKKLGSSNRKKAQLKVNKIYEKIANSRKDFIEKLSTKLLQENDVIVIESLSIKGMSQALNLGKSVMDLGYGIFVNRLEQKSLEQEKLVIKADKWFASSKICSTCGYIKNDLKLSDREWDCPKCHTHHYRDTNAGINLREFGLNKLLSRLEQPEEPLEISTLVEFMKEEAD